MQHEIGKGTLPFTVALLCVGVSEFICFDDVVVVVVVVFYQHSRHC